MNCNVSWKKISKWFFEFSSRNEMITNGRTDAQTYRSPWEVWFIPINIIIIIITIIIVFYSYTWNSGICRTQDNEGVTKHRVEGKNNLLERNPFPLLRAMLKKLLEKWSNNRFRAASEHVHCWVYTMCLMLTPLQLRQRVSRVSLMNSLYAFKEFNWGLEWILHKIIINLKREFEVDFFDRADLSPSLQRSMQRVWFWRPLSSTGSRPALISSLGAAKQTTSPFSKGAGKAQRAPVVLSQRFNAL